MIFRAGDVRWIVVRESLGMLAAGLAIGIPVALYFSGLVKKFLFQVKPHDPVTIVCAVVLMTLIAAIAAYGPARRATGLDPMIALRYE